MELTNTLETNDTNSLINCLLPFTNIFLQDLPNGSIEIVFWIANIKKNNQDMILTQKFQYAVRFQCSLISILNLFSKYSLFSTYSSLQNIESV